MDESLLAAENEANGRPNLAPAAGGATKPRRQLPEAI